MAGGLESELVIVIVGVMRKRDDDESGDHGGGGYQGTDGRDVIHGGSILVNVMFDGVFGSMKKKTRLVHRVHATKT